MTKKKTKRILRISLLIGTPISLWFVPWTMVMAWLTPLPDTVEQQVNDALKHDFDGIIVYVDKSGKPPEFYAAGWHDRKNKIPARPNAFFKIASISKLYDAVAITKLVNDKLLSWIDPPKSSKEALERVLDLPANFEPDTAYEYSNTNYLLISDLIDKVTGTSKFQFIKERILRPLELKNTFGSIHEVNINDVMSGYYVGIEEDIKAGEYGTKLTSMIATAEDVSVFLRALNDGSIFEKEEQNIYSSIYVYNHTGLIPGYMSIAKYHKDIDAVVVQFINTTDFEGYQWNLSEMVYNRIVKILRSEKSS
ncbi:serine hydrolase [uncultured Eudoraea sp.]|uniref:serine hydrolase domain-containing protein n=1 Tax=uncultured Eudoraea sp. TaxID=1035614 RepID=UPI00260CB91E|nr:serine hydrolase domain-containing protein [uncultured Eudoraea sp.]